MPLAERGATLADEGDGHAVRSLAREGHRDAGDGEAGDPERSGRGQDPPLEVADVEVPAVHGRPRLAHLRAQHHARGLRSVAHGEHGPEVADERRDDVAAPGPVGSAVRRAAAQPQGRAVDRLLAQRPEPLALEPDAAVLHVAAHEQRLEAVVQRAREHHPAQQLAPFGVGERGRDGLAPQEAVRRLQQVGGRAGQALAGGHAGRRLPQAADRAREAAAQRVAHGRAQALDGGGVTVRGGARAGLAPGLQGQLQRVRIALGHESAEARAEDRARGGGRADQGSMFQVSTLRSRPMSFSCSAFSRRISSARRRTTGGPTSRMKSITSRCASSV